MTNSSEPKAPKSSRKKPAREPATIDLKAKVVDDGSQQDSAWENMRPEETIVTETPPSAEDTVASPEATLDSGIGTDSIGPEDSSAPQEPPPPDGDRPQETPPTAPDRRPSTAALIGTGVLGGLVGAGLVYGVQTWMTPDPQNDQRIAQLEQRVSALGQVQPAQGQGNGNAPTADVQAIQERLQGLENAGASLEQRLQDIQNTAQQAAARAEEAANRPVPEAAPAPQNEAALNQLSERLSALESQLQAQGQSASDAANAVQGLEQRLAEQDSRLAEQNQRLTALSQQISEANEGAEATSEANTQLVLAERLSDALRSGTPFPDVLEGLRKTGASGERLSALEPFAQNGAPTAAALAQSFEPLEAQILRDQRAASGEWSDRLLRMMDKVVTVRPVDEPGSTGVAATVARIRQALGWGDIGAAAAAWASLPEPARRISEDWGRQVTALAGAYQANREIASDALATLNRSTQ